MYVSFLRLPTQWLVKIQPPRTLQLTTRQWLLQWRGRTSWHLGGTTRAIAHGHQRVLREFSVIFPLQQKILSLWQRPKIVSVLCFIFFPLEIRRTLPKPTVWHKTTSIFVWIQNWGFYEKRLTLREVQNCSLRHFTSAFNEVHSISGRMMASCDDVNGHMAYVWLLKIFPIFSTVWPRDVPSCYLRNRLLSSGIKRLLWCVFLLHFHISASSLFAR